MNVTEVPSDGTRSLAEHQEFLRQQEEGLGPLVDLGNDGTNTVLTFNLDDPPPATSSVTLHLTPGGQTPIVPGSKFICQGNGIVAGQQTGVAAFQTSGAQPAVTPASPGAVPVSPASPGTAAASPAGSGTTAAVPHGFAPAAIALSEAAAATGFKSLILASAHKFGIPPSIVAGIGSQESGWGTSSLMHPSGPAGTGDAAHRSPKPPSRPGSLPPDGGGFGRGLMQIDWDFHDFARTGDWKDPAANIDFGCSLLAGFVKQAANTLHLAGADAMTVAVAAYNAGFGGASTNLKNHGLASLTAPGQYAAKVLARAAFYAANGFTP